MFFFVQLVLAVNWNEIFATKVFKKFSTSRNEPTTTVNAADPSAGNYTWQIVVYCDFFLNNSALTIG